MRYTPSKAAFDYPFPPDMCIAEFTLEMARIAATCAPGTRTARDQATALMIRCLHSNGYGEGLDILRRLVGEDES